MLKNRQTAFGKNVVLLNWYNIVAHYRYVRTQAILADEANNEMRFN